MDKSALLKAIKDAEAKAAKDLEEAKAAKAAAVASAQADADRIRREGLAAVDGEVAEMIAEARRRIDVDKQEKVAAGRVRLRRKREGADARVPQVAEFLVQEFEKSVQAGLR
jgi:vacuolar-type H+-ATPase subunit H